MLFNRLIAISCCLLFTISAIAQSKEAEIKFGDIKPEDFKAEYYSVDSSADAVFLFDIGSSHYESGAMGGLSLFYKVHKRIRLLHKKSFDDVTAIKIYLFDRGNNSDNLEDLQASTFTFENQKVIETKVDKNSIFKNKNGEVQIVTFTFPNLKEGCIIEYSYVEKIPLITYIPSWSFQSSYPHLWSEYTVEVPQFLDFVTLNQGYLEPLIDTGSVSASNFSVSQRNYSTGTRIYTFRSNTIRHTWAFENVPSLKTEQYITNLSNYKELIEFQLQAIRYPGEEPIFFMSDWSETVDQLMKNKIFGLEISKENNWLKDDINTALQKENDPLKKATKIYEYVRSNYSCIDHSALSLSQPLKKTFEAKKGDVADINLLLVAMLRYAGFTTDPVILSTRTHGKTYDIYPILNKYNYVIARLTLDNNTYLLDAADKFTGFGFLPPDCYNGNAMTITQPPEEIDLSSDSLQEKSLISLFLSNDSNETIAGSYKSVMGEIESYNLRNKLNNSSKDEYSKEIKNSFSFDANIKNLAIDSLYLFDDPISVEYDINFRLAGDVIYFNPMLSEAEKENPFHAAERLYPVEMPYCIDKVYVLNMEIPEGYAIDELPKPAKVTLNENEGMFEYIIQQANGRIQLQCRIKLNKANFDPEDYETLRNFFSIIVAKESEQIVFKKQ